MDDEDEDVDIDEDEDKDEDLSSRHHADGSGWAPVGQRSLGSGHRLAAPSYQAGHLVPVI